MKKASKAVNGKLDWHVVEGWGYLPGYANGLYGQTYFDEYKRRSETAIGHNLTITRSALVSMFYEGDLLDVGIGAGHFIEAGLATHGFDVNPVAIAWLEEKGKYRNPFNHPVNAASCWDSLEHMHSPWLFLETVKQWLFVSIPIFRDYEHAISSKHYKPNEHLWYFTHNGFIRWMKQHDFACVYYDNRETKLGREDIESFVFEKTKVSARG